MPVLRFITAGSVDDGKSTLIGRLLYDSKSLLRDQVAALERVSTRTGGKLNLALLTDGLRAEREQGITIDVAYKYFATPRRSFRIADTPGHVQYTRNMVTAASTADLAIVLVDARHGVLEQTRRHAYLATFLRIPHIVLAVNKMDAVGWSPEIFERTKSEFRSFLSDSHRARVQAIPMSALEGDNVVNASTKTPFYEGPPLLRYLEEVELPKTTEPERARLPVQIVLRPTDPSLQDYRAFAGSVSSGAFRPGDEVIALPSGVRSVVESVDQSGAPVLAAYAPSAVALRLRDDVDVGRGELICSALHPPRVSNEVTARVCWMTEKSLISGTRLLVRHTTATVVGVVAGLDALLDVHSFVDTPNPKALALNDIGLVRIKLARPIPYETYEQDRTLGSFVLVDEATNNTVGAGVIM